MRPRSNDLAAGGPPPRGRRARSNAVVVGAIALLVAFVAVLQVRSQAEVRRSLEGQDNTSLAFLIDDLHRANDQLAVELATLTARRDPLRSGGGEAANAQLGDDLRRLQVVDGLVPVHGPGVVIAVDAPLELLDIQDALNSLRNGGAEAVELNGRRVLTTTPLRASPGGVSVDGYPLRGPFTLAAIGDPTRLGGVADLMTRSLRGDPRVRAASYRADPDLQIRSTAVQRPFVYGSP